MRERQHTTLSSDIVNQALMEFFRNNPMFNPLPKDKEPSDMVLVEDSSRVDQFILYYDLEE